MNSCFLDETLPAFVNYKLYQSINVKYPPILDPRLEALAADLYALSRYFDANGQSSSTISKASNLPGSEETQVQQDGKKHEESELRLAQLQHQLPSNEAGALMHLVEDASKEDEEDVETLECKNLFKNIKFFLSREVPRESLLFIIPAFGGMVSWEGEGEPFQESDQSITHQRDVFLHHICLHSLIMKQKVMFLSMQKLLSDLRLLKVLPLPGMGKDDLDDPQSLLGIIDRAEAIEAAKKKQKVL